MTNQAIAEKQGYVTCREKITSPIADEVGMTPNMECSERFQVGPFSAVIGGAALVRCPRGHQFYVAIRDLSDV
jgi:hypothetical protein